jgi:hypothetical protein
MKSARVAGDIMEPLKGLRKFRFHYSEFCNELLTQATWPGCFR